MALRLWSISTALVFLLAATSGTRGHRRTSAAFVRAASYLPFQRDLLLFNVLGQAVFTRRKEIQELSVFGLHLNFNITAATCSSTANIPLSCIFYGNEQIYNGSHLFNYHLTGDRPAFREFLWHGIDAAVDAGWSQYYFKGCHYMRNWDPFLRNVAELKFPCNLDAAWSYGPDIVALQGEQVWYAGKGLDQPLDLEDYLREKFLDTS